MWTTKTPTDNTPIGEDAAGRYGKKKFQRFQVAAALKPTMKGAKLGKLFRRKNKKHADAPMTTVERAPEPTVAEIQSTSFTEPSTTDTLGMVSNVGFHKDDSMEADPTEAPRSSSLTASISSVGLSVRDAFKKSIAMSLMGWLVFGDDSERSSVASPRHQSRASMLRWANRFQFASTRERVTNTSHFVASSPWGISVERALMPWTPSSVESLACFLLIFSLLLTVPFGITRVKSGRWTGYFFQQAAINWMLNKLGLEPMFDGDTKYLAYGTDDENPTRPGIDLAFGLHIVFGVLWIIFGGMQ
jgi:hypothetical protein